MPSQTKSTIETPTRRKWLTWENAWRTIAGLAMLALMAGMGFLVYALMVAALVAQDNACINKGYPRDTEAFEHCMSLLDRSKTHRPQARSRLIPYEEYLDEQRKGCLDIPYHDVETRTERGCDSKAFPVVR